MLYFQNKTHIICNKITKLYYTIISTKETKTNKKQLGFIWNEEFPPTVTA